MKLSIISANVGNFDSASRVHRLQDIPSSMTVDCKIFTNLLPRPLSISNRMQSKIFKMCGFDYAIDSDLIIWIDGACSISSPKFIKWMISCLGDGDICLMPHNSRHSIMEELQYVCTEMCKGNKYLISRYSGELMEQQVHTYLTDKTFKDDHLASAGCFIYKNNDIIRAALKDWLIECVKWSCQDQLSLTYVLHKHGIKPRWLDYNIFNCPYLNYSPHDK